MDDSEKSPQRIYIEENLNVLEDDVMVNHLIKKYMKSFGYCNKYKHTLATEWIRIIRVEKTGKGWK